MITREKAARIIEGRYSDFLNAIATAGGETVKEPMTLTRYLDLQGYPRWWQRILFNYQGVQVGRRGADGLPSYETGISTSQLRAGDPVPRVGEFPPDGEEAQYNRDLEAARDTARDYVLVLKDLDEDYFDPDLLIGHVQDMHQNRGVFVRDRTPEDGQLTLEDLVRTVGEDRLIDGPPKRIVVVSHAHWQGQLLFAPTTGSPDKENVTFESIDAIPAAKLRMPDFYLDTRIPPARRPDIVFTGCQIGRALPLITKLRDAIDPKLRAYAPKYWYGVIGDGNPEYAEYMSQPFEIYSTTGMSRAAVVAHLEDRADPNPFNQRVPRSEWEALVPPDNPATPWDAAGFYRPGGDGTGTFLWYEILEEDFEVSTSMTRAQFETDRLRRFTEAAAAVPATPNPTDLFAPNHPFPMWKRFGFNSATELLAKFSAWSFEFVEGTAGSPNVINATGHAHHYTMLVPIGIASATAPWRHRFLVRNRYIAGRTDPLGAAPDAPTMPLSDTKFWGMIPPR